MVSQQLLLFHELFQQSFYKRNTQVEQIQLHPKVKISYYKSLEKSVTYATIDILKLSDGTAKKLCFRLLSAM